MKKMKKRLLAFGLCLAILLGSLTPVQVADAASKKVKITVGYKGKNATLWLNKVYNKNRGEVMPYGNKTYASVKKKWGKANKVEKRDGYNFYTWKSGKTSISFGTTKKGKRSYKEYTGGFYIDIRNKKASLCGVKVGMTKKQALQKLRKQFGKKSVFVENNCIYVNTPPLCYMEFALKSGKVKSIYWFSS